MSDEAKMGEGFARLEILVENARKQSAESAETRERAAVERHDKLAREVGSLKTAHTNLALVVGSLQTKVNQVERFGPEFAAHAARDEEIVSAMAVHISKIEKTTTSTALETIGQSTELDKQTRILMHLRAITPILTAIASAAAAYFAGHH